MKRGPLAVLALALLAFPVTAQITARTCLSEIRDMGTGGCLTASSAAHAGQLFPLSVDFYLDPFSRYIGMGTLFPQYPLHVVQPPSGTNITMQIQNARVGGRGIWSRVTDLSETDVSVAVFGSSSARLGSAIVGNHRSDSLVTATGVSGITSGGGAGVAGVGLDPLDDNDGVYGTTYSQTIGAGVDGRHFATTGTGAGVEGYTYSLDANALGVYGEVQPLAPGSASAGVRGRNRGTGDDGYGVHGTHNGDGIGVFGFAQGSGVGVLGQAGSGGTAIFAVGDLGATGVKSFVQPHPFDPSKEIRFVCLEGNESGTYFRGSGRLVNGRAIVVVPEAFRLVTEDEGLTVQLTGLGRGDLWIERKDLDEIHVAGERDIAFDYLVNGVRRGHAGFQAIRENRSFVPHVRGEVYASPDAVRELLVENGTLNADFTPSERTARRMGWTLHDPAPEPLPSPMLEVVPARSDRE